MIRLPRYLLLDALIGYKGTGGGPPPPPAWNISSFIATPNVIEVGASQTVTLNWIMTNNPDSQSINNGIGSLAVSARSVVTPVLNTTTTYTLSATKSSNPYSANTTINFRKKRYWFVSADPNIGNSAFAYGTLPVGFSEEFTAQRMKNNVEFDCNGGRYFYYMYPAEYGVASGTQLIFNSFSVELDPANIRTVNFTNQSGYTSSYIVLRSDNLLNSDDIFVNFL